MAVFTQISPLPAPSLSYSLTNDLFSLSVCRDAKYRQRQRKRGREKKAIKGAAKANADDRKEMGSAVIAHTHIKVGCCHIRSLLLRTNKTRQTV